MLNQDDDDLDDDSLSSFDGENRASPKKKRLRSSKIVDASVDSAADAALIAAATEEHLRSLNIDPNSKEGKRQRRKIRNRMSAQLHRERKKNYIDSLEEQVRQRDQKIFQLQEHVRMMQSENCRLRDQLMSVCPSFDLGPHAAFEYTSEEDGRGSSCESDTESLSTATTKSGGVKFGTGLSLFSFFIMFGLTFWGLPSVPSSTDLVPATSLNVMPVFFNQHSSSQSVEFSVPSRRLLLSDSEDETRENAKLPVIPVINNINNNLLWSYEDSIALYPNTRLGPVAPVESATTIRKPRLRTRGSRNSTSSTSTEANFEIPRMETYSHYNKVLVTSGKALLDPSFALVKTFRSPRDMSSHDESSKSVVPSIVVDSKALSLSHWTAPAPVLDGDKATALTVAVADPSIATSASASASAPMLMMLLPASLIQWGTTWDSSKSNDEMLKSYMQDLWKENKTTTDGDSNSEDKQPILWVEIGCSVFKAQVVRNVTIS
jgi:hypothetical protein